MLIIADSESFPSIQRFEVDGLKIKIAYNIGRPGPTIYMTITMRREAPNIDFERVIGPFNLGPYVRTEKIENLIRYVMK